VALGDARGSAEGAASRVRETGDYATLGRGSRRGRRGGEHGGAARRSLVVVSETVEQASRGSGAVEAPAPTSVLTIKTGL
jgi:hypothetical protein